MQISAAMQAKLNQQVTHEFHASQSYLAMSCQFEVRGLKNLAALFRKQSNEERGHALKLVEYLLDVGADVSLGEIPAPKTAYATPLAAIEAAIKHEKKVTRQIHDLVALADKEKDYATRSFLNWFVDEQVEEINSMEHVEQLARMAEDRLLQLESAIRHLLEGKGG